MLKNKLGKHKSKAIGALITIFIVVLLVLVGPAEALSLAIDNLGKKPFERGKIIKITGVINVDPDEIFLPKEVGFIQLKIDGPGDNDRLCKFRLNGKLVSEEEECKGIKINLTSSTTEEGYGYLVGGGYGYGVTDGKLVYEIRINTEKFANGKYRIQLRAADIRSKIREFVIVGKNNEEPDEGNDDKPKEEVIICHVPSEDTGDRHTIKVSPRAVRGHLEHGDYLGECRPSGELPPLEP